VISPSHRPLPTQDNTTQNHKKKTKTNIYAPSGIRTHDPSSQAAKPYALNHAVTVTGLSLKYTLKFPRNLTAIGAVIYLLTLV
jgi:hypothetical protein